MLRRRRNTCHRRSRNRFPVVTEALEQRQFFSSAHAVHPRLDAITIDNGSPSDPNMPAPIQLANRWTSTATNSTTGATGTGITLTWSIVPDGTMLGSGDGEADTPSDLHARLDAIYGSQSNWMPVVQKVFDEWGSISGVSYVYEPNDDGAAYANGSTGKGVLGVRGDVRIGSHPIDGAYNILAYNWFPVYGDMVIDSNDLVSGGFMFNTASNSLRLRNVMAHEHGHGLGLNHTDPIDGTKLMEATASVNFDGPQFDDMLSVQRYYGDVYEKGAGDNISATAVNRGTITSSDTISNVSLATTGDLDYYKFTLGSSQNTTITLAPAGPTYLQGPQNGTVSSFNASAQMDLQLQVLSSNGTTVLSTANATSVGGSEIVSLSGLSAGTYFIKVMPASGATDNAQMYTLTTNVGAPVATSTAVAIDTSGNLTITDTATGGKNDALIVAVDAANSRYVVSDPNNFLGTTIGGAAGSGTHSITVPFSAVAVGAQVKISTGAGTDAITVNGTNVPVSIDAGAGADTISVAETSSAAPVTVIASSGNDAVSVNTDNSGSAKVLVEVPQQLGAVSIGAGGIATLSGSNSVAVVTSLSITGGQLNLGNNDLAINYAAATPAGAWNGATNGYTGVTGLVASGYDGGAWDGSGIVTTMSTAVTPNSLTTLAVAEASDALGLTSAQTTVWNGQTIDGTTVLVKYTYAGDANLDGVVNGDDYFQIDSAFPQGGHGWTNGDFNYDGVITGDDYFLIDSVFPAQGAAL